MENTNTIEYKISAHAETRYAERIMEKDTAYNINKFINENKEKIKTDINKMIQFGECIFVGKQSQKDGKGNVLNVYLKDCWVILVDNSNETCVTLYKIDLGLDDEFNKTYVSKMIEKLNAAKKTLEDAQLEIQIESNTYKDLIYDAEAQIADYKVMIKNLENMCEGYKQVIDNNVVKVSQATREVAEIVNTLINKREF